MTTSASGPVTGRCNKSDRLAELSIETFLDRLAARRPAPGGGAVAAIHAAQSAALLAMVAQYSTGPRFAASADLIKEVLRTAERCRATCLRLADRDANAFGAVAAAYSLPKKTAADLRERKRTITAALMTAAGPPVDVIAASVVLVTLAETLLPVANRTVVTDIAAATEAARAAATTARLNVEVNLTGIDDTTLLEKLTSVLAQVDAVVERAAAMERSVRELLA